LPFLDSTSSPIIVPRVKAPLNNTNEANLPIHQEFFTVINKAYLYYISLHRETSLSMISTAISTHSSPIYESFATLLQNLRPEERRDNSHRKNNYHRLYNSDERPGKMSHTCGLSLSLLL
jgi:hypothetical protein